MIVISVKIILIAVGISNYSVRIIYIFYEEILLKLIFLFYGEKIFGIVGTCDQANYYVIYIIFIHHIYYIIFINLLMLIICTLFFYTTLLSMVIARQINSKRIN